METNERPHWPETVDEILDGDQAVALAYVTPASGVVIAPVTNFGVRDRERGTITVNSSVAAWKKLDRIRRNPHVALAFHTREHGTSRRPEYVLIQGRATLSEPIPDYPSTIIEHWERHEQWRAVGRLRKRWLRVFALRVAIEVAAERVIVWPDLACRGPIEVIGSPPPADPPPSQDPPARGTGARMHPGRAARRARRLPHVLLGWVGADGLPLVVPAAIGDATNEGIRIDSPLLPPGRRRAGLTAHWFAPRVVGQAQRIHTGWLDASTAVGRAVYAPHTLAAYRFPASTLLFHVIAGAATRWRLRGARRAGLLPA